MKRFLGALLTFLFFNTTYAHKGGGGGGAFVCRTDDMIHSAVFQDIWEAEEQGIPIMKASESEWTERDLSYELISKLKKVSPKFYGEVEKALDEVMKIKNIGAIKLIPLGDSKHTKEPFDCEKGKSDYLSVAQYISDDLTYSEKIWSQFTRLIEKSATHAHEAIYKVLRDEYKDEDSEKTRDIVGLISSSEDQWTNLKRIVPFSEFNPRSSKKFKEKFDELVLTFNQGKKVHPRDLNEIGENCFGFNKRGNRDLDFDILDVINEKNIGIEKKVKKNKTKKRVVGTLRFDMKKKDPFILKYINPLVGNYDPSEDLGGNYRTSMAYYKLSNDDLVERVEKKFFTDGIVWTTYLMSKDQFGNIILAMRDPKVKSLDGRACIKFKNFATVGTCKTYEEVNVLKQDKYFDPVAMLFCPSVKSL